MQAVQTKYRVEEVERQLENMSRERLLPNDKTLEKVARYEAHLSRMLCKSMHELEALQISAWAAQLLWPAST